MNTNKIIDGKSLANQLINKLKVKIDQYLNLQLRKPKLIIVQVGSVLASTKYIVHKKRAAIRVGMDIDHILLNQEIREQELINKIRELNLDSDIDGIIVQLPLPKHINPDLIIDTINPNKDADGFHPWHMGKIVIAKENKIIPATPKAIMTILKNENIDLIGKNITVIGRSNIVGKPIANILINEHATVTICNSKTNNLNYYTQHADILIVAIGSANFIKNNMVKKNAVIIDVGINFINKKLVGDVDFNDVINKISRITPVPGGVGPLTVYSLLDNVFKLYCENIKK